MIKERTWVKEVGPVGHLVLVVDDISDTRRVMKMFLEYKGFRVAEASGGAEAVSVASSVLPGLVLMDLSMPDVDGLAAARRMREDPRLSATPIVIVSAFDVPEVRSQIVGAGHRYVAKPIDFNHMGALIDMLMADLR